MLVQVTIESTERLYFEEFKQLLGIDDIVLAISPDEEPEVCGFYREKTSNTMFLVERVGEQYVLSMDMLASYEDYRFFPYLLDTLCSYLTGESYCADGKNAFQIYNEEWIADAIGEEIAYLKCVLKLGHGYYITLPLTESPQCVTEDVLNQYGVTIYSSTPRIYGYTSYLLRHNLLPEDYGVMDDEAEEMMVDVPQHVSIGTVLSWQTDGSETTESYSAEDVKLLLSIAERYRNGESFDGVVLNDIGTIYEYAIGVPRIAEEAVYWFKEAIKQGDSLYAPTSLGDIYRRGLDNIESNLALALDAYKQSIDPYSWYRIGQSYEEGWVSEPDMHKAMEYYHKAANVGHHLALRRLERDDEY